MSHKVRNMAAVYEYRPDVNRYRSLLPVSDSTIDRLLTLGEEPVEAWKAPQLRWMGAIELSDFPSLLGHVPVVSDRALEVLGPLMGPMVDTLPIRVEGGGYSMLHVRDFPDCLDTRASRIRWFEPGRARMIEQYVFVPERLRGHHLFRLKERPNGLAFLSDAAMQAICNAKLIGLEQALLWTE
jgi:hypothetical protein